MSPGAGGVRLGLIGWGALAAVGLACAAVVTSGAGLLEALRTPSATGASDREAVLAQQASEAEKAMSSAAAQFNGRSLFFVPGPPPPPPPPAPPPTPDPGPPPPPPPPATYGGPGIMAIVFDVVWFSDGKRLQAGEGNDELRVVRLEAPWGVVVTWKGVEFTVPLFERDKVVAPARTLADEKEDKDAKPEPGAPADGPGADQRAEDPEVVK